MTSDLGDHDADIARRFSGLDRLYGIDGAARIRDSHVVVVGVGGVGSWAAESLARSGVGCLTLIDMDHVAESNVNRQVHAISSTLGMAKVMALRNRIGEINPKCMVRTIEEFVTPDNWRDLCPADARAVIDACDQVQAKTAMASHALSAGKAPFFLVTVGAAGGKKMAHRVEVDDLSSVTHDPLLARLRYNLRKAFPVLRGAKAMRLACVFSREPVAFPDASCSVSLASGSLNCHGYGSVVSVTATFGMCAAGLVIDRMSGAR